MPELIAVSSNSTRSSSSKIPKLSVLLATKDQAATLERCLQGILSQTFEDYELIILNDGSTDDTPQILERFKRLDPRIQLFNHGTPRPLGVRAFHPKSHLFLSRRFYGN